MGRNPGASRARFHAVAEAAPVTKRRDLEFEPEGTGHISLVVESALRRDLREGDPRIPQKFARGVEPGLPQIHERRQSEGLAEQSFLRAHGNAPTRAMSATDSFSL